MPTSFYNNLQTRIRRLLPKGLQTAGDFHFFCFITCSTFFLSLLCPWMAWLGLATIAQSTSIAALVCALIGLARLRGLSLPIASQFYQTTLITVVLYSTWHMGGLSSPAMVWLGIVPLLPWFTMSRGWTFAWLIIAFVSVWVFLGFHLWGWLPIKEGYSLVDLLVSATMYGLLCLTQGILLITLDTADADNIRAMQQTTQVISLANAKLLEASRHKDQFLAMVSHAMRTPLNGVKGYLGLLGDRQDLGHEAQQEVAGAQNAASHLLTVINDLLDLSQISQGRFSLSPQVIQLPESVRDIFKILASHADGLNLAYRLTIDPDVPSWVKVDLDRLAQILINLLGNAIKFTPQGEVHLMVSVKEVHPTQITVAFAVQDSGTGIADDQLVRIFEPFYQAHTQAVHPDNENLRGNGLGLAISRGLATAMGGELNVTSQLGVGSCFRLQLPLPLASAPVINQDAPVIPDMLDLHPYRILLVDDQAVNRAVLAATLKKILPNAQLAQADGGFSALQHLHDHECDLVLVDLIMPDLDGIEVVRRTRQFKDPSHRDVPFIALTANLAQEAVANCLAVGMVEVMPKPFNRQGLLRAIQNHARRSATELASNA